MTTLPLPLSGYRILDLGHYIADPYATRILADYGAEVIKVETGQRPDMTRRLPPFIGGEPDPNRAGWFLNANYNKRGLDLDLSKPRGRDLLLRLVLLSDAVTENFSSAVLERLGLGYSVLRSVKEDIILLQMPGYGQTGPYRDLRAVGPTISAFAGIDATIGWSDGPPLPTGRIPVPDYLNALGGAVALLAAFEHRARTGQGQHIELSQHENTVATQGAALLQVQTTGEWPARNGNRDPVAVPQGVFRCRDENTWCAVSIQGDVNWWAFCQISGQEALARDERFATILARHRHAAEAEAILAAYVVNLTAEEAEKELQAVAIAASVVRSMSDLANDPQLIHRDFFPAFERPDLGRVTVTGSAARFSETPARVRHPAPAVGQDNHYVLAELLGLSDGEIGELVSAGIVGEFTPAGATR